MGLKASQHLVNLNYSTAPHVNEQGKMSNFEENFQFVRYKEGMRWWIDWDKVLEDLILLIGVDPVKQDAILGERKARFDQ